MRARPGRRLHSTTRIAAVTIIAAGPIAVTAWDLTHPPFASYTELWPDAYLAQRSPLIDELLPAGAGGTRYFKDLGDKGGLAAIGPAAIAIAPADYEVATIESIELHERGHLLHAYLSGPVNRLLARTPQPAPDEYAAEDPGEHLSEMAANAWLLVAPLQNVCVVDPGELLRTFEAAVPGTAGFVAWFLRHPELASFEARESLLAEADRIIAPLREEWNAVWDGVEERRQESGTLTPWPVMNVRQAIAARRDAALTSGSLIEALVAVLLWPSQVLAGRD